MFQVIFLQLAFYMSRFWEMHAEGSYTFPKKLRKSYGRPMSGDISVSLYISGDILTNSNATYEIGEALIAGKTVGKTRQMQDKQV